MEKKTLGTFLAALRKAGGMTQRDLAEALNVSDKAVSRWERDECAPDITLLPVIADLFDVTVDELLRGERAPREEEQTEEARIRLAEKAERRKQILLHRSLIDFRSRSLVMACVGGSGFIVAMLCNFAFLRAQAGFFTAVVCYLGAVVSEVVLALRSRAFAEDQEMGAYNAEVVRTAARVLIFIGTLFCATLPLIVFCDDPYAGLAGAAFFVYALIFGGAGFVLLFALWHLFVCPMMEKHEILPLPPMTAEQQAKKKRCFRRCLAAFLATAIPTGIAIVVVFELDTRIFASPLVFHDYPSFKAYMEEDIPWNGEGMVTEITVPPEEDEEAKVLDRILADDGTVLCEFYWNNRAVSSYSLSVDDGGTPLLKVYTRDGLAQSMAISQGIVVTLLVLLVLEIMIPPLVYDRKKKRILSEKSAEKEESAL